MEFELVLHCLTLQTSSKLRIIQTTYWSMLHCAIWLQMIKDPIFDFESSPEKSRTALERNSH